MRAIVVGIFTVGCFMLGLGIIGLFDWLVTDLGIEFGTGVNHLTRITVGCGFIMTSMGLNRVE